MNSDFHGALGRTEASGAVDDMVERRRTRRRGAVLDAMVSAGRGRRWRLVSDYLLLVEKVQNLVMGLDAFTSMMSSSTRVDQAEDFACAGEACSDGSSMSSGSGARNKGWLAVRVLLGMSIVFTRRDVGPLTAGGERGKRRSG